MATESDSNWLRAQRLRRPRGNLTLQQQLVAATAAQTLLEQVGARLQEMGCAGSDVTPPEFPDHARSRGLYWLRGHSKAGWMLWCVNGSFMMANVKTRPNEVVGGDITPVWLPLWDSVEGLWRGRYVPENDEFRPALDELLVAAWDALLGEPIRNDDLTLSR